MLTVQLWLVPGIFTICDLSSYWWFFATHPANIKVEVKQKM
jgi:hypothetical protein